MESFDIERLAQEACFSTQYDVKCKAEEKFYSLCLNISQYQLQQLMKGYSQNVLFVVMEYIEKIISTLNDPQPLFLAINETVEQWYNTNLNATLIRGDGIALQYHVENSVSRTLGQCLKCIYLQKEKQEWVKEIISSRSNLRYRLFLWKVFVETVSVVDSNLSFLNYRSLVYSFQENIIPLIMDALLPFFRSVKQEIQIADLSICQSMLSVDDQNQSKNPQISLFNPNELKFTKMVFQVLKEIICFNYNITYSQFQSETPIENCLVCFPEEVTKKVANKQFILSIFYVAEKLINDSYQSSNTNSIFLATTLQCIQKIVLTKLFYTPSETKQAFIQTILSCLSKLLESPKLTQQIILSLIQSNHKLLINIQLYMLRPFHAEYERWLKLIRAVVMTVLERSVVVVDGVLVADSLELVLKVVEESSSPHLKAQQKFYKSFGQDAALLVLTRMLTQGESIIGNAKIRSFQELKKNLGQFMKRVKNLSCLNLNQIFQKLQPQILSILHSNNPNSISNIYLILSQFCDGTVLNRNILYEMQDRTALHELGKIIYYSLEWINKFRALGEAVEIIQVSILIFMEKILTEMLGSFSYDDGQIRITSEMFKIIAEGRPFLGGQQFLSFCFQQIATNLLTGDYNRSSYTFQTLTSLLLKFKWGIRRQYFKQTAIAKDFLQMCHKLSQKQFDGQTLTLRKQLYKIITNISFDDTLDDYRTNIDELIRSLENNLSVNKWRVMYDLTGICEAIDTSAIYRYFLIRLDNSKIAIHTVMDELFRGVEAFQMPAERFEAVKGILRLQLSMIENKGQRLTTQKNIFYNYKIISQLMPYWAGLLEQLEFQSQEWDEAVILLYKMFNTILRNGNTNFFMLERTVPSYPSFMRHLLANMCGIQKWVEQYPQVFEEYRGVLVNMSTNLMEVIFCNKDSQIVVYFNQILNNILQINIKTMATLSHGNKNIEDGLEIQIDIIKNIFNYLKYAKKLQHKQTQIKNFPILNQGIQYKFNYILALFKFGITMGKKMPRILDSICKTINNMDFLAGASIQLMSDKLGLVGDVKDNLFRIWRENQIAKGQFGSELEEDQFVIDIKEWFRSCNSSTMVDPDY